MCINPFRFWRHFSFVRKISIIILCLAALSITGMFISERTSENIQGNAHMINRVGAMRMQSYRILALSEDTNTASITDELDTLQKALEAPHFKLFIRNEHFEKSYQSIINQWNTSTRPILSSSAPLLQKINSIQLFIKKLNILISKIDTHTERQIAAISNTQNLFILLTLIFLFLAFSGLHKRLFTPWRSLLRIANAIREGDFDQRFKSHYYRDEMAVLGSALNDMSDQLKLMYDDLEQRVQTKTIELEQQNQYLDFLYRSGQIFNRHRLSIHALDTLFKELITIAALDRVTFYPSNDLRYIIDTPLDYSNPDAIVAAPLCNTWNVCDDSQEYGVLRALSIHTIPSIKTQLIETFCDLFTQYLGSFIQEQRTHQLLVLEERHTIARELHDSIAQSLSFLKIKSGILRMQSNNLSAEQQLLLGEISQEVTTAYHQLRELLTTFRLTLDEPSLFNAIQKSINEYNEKLGFVITFNNQWSEHCIRPQQAIHILQIIRESLSNIYKHSRATKVVVNLYQDITNQCYLSITDNGIGLSKQAHQLSNHYGLNIIADRVKALPGELTISTEPQRGTKLSICFNPIPKD